MLIAVDAVFLSKDYLKNNNIFIIECISRWVRKYPQHEFLYITNHDFEKTIVDGDIKNVSHHYIHKKWVSKYWLYKIKIPSILKKRNASVFISATAPYLNATIPFCLIFTDTGLKKIKSKSFEKADRIAVTSSYIKEKIVAINKIEEHKIDMVRYGIFENFKIIPEQEKEFVKNEYTEGKDYFLYSGSFNAEKLIQLLKAFSHFKKWQKSNMQLIIVNRYDVENKHFLENLKTYTYRSDVKIVGNLIIHDLVSITAAAYAAIYFPIDEYFDSPIIEAMKCEIPVIAGEAETIYEIGGDALRYVNQNSIEQLGNHLIEIYKNESTRNDMIAAGINYAKQYDWDITADLLWQSVLKTITT